MLWVLFLLLVVYNGFILSSKFLPLTFKKILLSSSFIVGSIVSIDFITILLIIFKNLNVVLEIYIISSLIIFIFTFRKHLGILKQENNKKRFWYIPVLFIAFIVFEKSFSYDSISHTFLIESNLYWDFGTHIPFARFLTGGGNFIPEVPFFGGKNLMYHFMYDFYVGILEHLGLRLDYAFNLLSSLSFVALCSFVIEFGMKLFKSFFIGIFTIILFVLGSDLSFIDIFKKSGSSFFSLYHHDVYLPANFFGIQIDKYFLNINVLLNQRHIIFGLAFAFFIFIILFNSSKLSNKQIGFIAILIGFFVFWHESLMLSIYFVLFLFALLFKKQRSVIFKTIFFSALLSIPQLLLIKLTSGNTINFHPGFILYSNLSPARFILFWLWNLGLALPLSIFSFINSNFKLKKIFISFLILFILGNAFQFTRDIFDNHKMFNLWILLIDMFVGFTILKLIKKSLIHKILAAFLIVFLTVSGFFHLLVVKNDVYARIPDYKDTTIGKWIKSNIKGEEIVLTNGDIYDPASVAGKKTFLGINHFVFTFGGDPSLRIAQREKILSGKDTREILAILKSSEIKYIIIYKQGFAKNELPANLEFLNNGFKKVFEDSEGIIYKT